MASPERYLADRRIRIAIWSAVAEGVLVIFGIIPHLVVYVLAIVAIGFWILVGRSYKPGTSRQAAWIFATSQLLVVLVPIFWFFAKTTAIIVIALIAVGGLVFLFAEREHS
jgi:hypothetical protein